MSCWQQQTCLTGSRLASSSVFVALARLYVYGAIGSRFRRLSRVCYSRPVGRVLVKLFILISIPQRFTCAAPRVSPHFRHPYCRLLAWRQGSRTPGW